MSSELAVIVPNQAEMLAKQGIVFKPGQTLSKTIREHIRDVEKLKGAVARERFYEVLRNTVAPAIAALVQQATQAGWLQEIRFGKNDVDENGSAKAFTVRHFKPTPAGLTKITKSAYDQFSAVLLQAGFSPESIEETIRKAGMEVAKPRKPKELEVVSQTSEPVAQS